MRQLEGGGGGAVKNEVLEKPEKGLELARGIEPPTGGLQNHCSAIELRQPCCFFAHLAVRVKEGGGNCARNCARELPCGLTQVRIAHDRIAPVNRFRFVSGDLHGDR